MGDKKSGCSHVQYHESVSPSDKKSVEHNCDNLGSSAFTYDQNRYIGECGQPQQHHGDQILARNNVMDMNTSRMSECSRNADNYSSIHSDNSSNDQFNSNHPGLDPDSRNRSQQQGAYYNWDDTNSNEVSPKKLKLVDQVQPSNYSNTHMNSRDKWNDNEACKRIMMEIDDIKQEVKNIPGVCGLENLGNTCYMNSGLQCLSNIPQMREFFLSANLPERRLTQPYAHLMGAMWSGKYTCVRADKVKERVSEYSSIFRGYDQADTREFVNVLLNSLHDELKNDADKSIINKLFAVIIKSQLTCQKCFYNEDSKEPMNFLALRPNVQNSRRTTLDDLLTLFREPKPLNGDLECNKCQQPTPHSMKKIIDHPLPPIMIVHFTRFNRTRVKNENPIEFPMKYNFDDLDESNQSCYELIGIVSHVGSVYGGHYTAYAKNSVTERWYHFNDRSTYPMDGPVNEPSIARNAYMLIYSKEKRY